MAGKLTPEQEIEALKAEISRLTGALSDAAVHADEAARREMFFKNSTDEVPTGRTVKVPKCTGYETQGYKDDGTPIRRPNWEEVEVPTFLYKIDMPPVGGTQILINGVAMYHGETYELTLDQLRTVKEVVYRLQAHEAAIHGTDENVYRPKTNARFSGKTGGRVH